MKRFEHSGSKSAFFPITRKITKEHSVKDLRTFFKDSIATEEVKKDEANKQEIKQIAKDNIEQIVDDIFKMDPL